jgi:hypothetical protein
MLASNDQIDKQVQGKHGKKQLALTLASVYHPRTKTGNDKMYLCFLDTLNTLLNQLLEKSKIIVGANINSNMGTLDDLHSTVFALRLGLTASRNATKRARISSKFSLCIVCAS